MAKELDCHLLIWDHALVSQQAKKIPIIIIIACVALILISAYMEKNKKAEILESLEPSIQSTSSTEE